MKTPIAAAILGASLLALPVAAQTATSPAASPGAAATLPNAFEDAAPARPAAPSATPATDAPDAARAEHALRAAIASFQSGDVDYSVFSDDLATQIRAQASTVAPMVKNFGALKSVDHVGQQDGAELFRVMFENQATDWVIAFNDADRIAALLFRPARD